MNDREKAKPSLQIPEPVLELVERRLAERVEQRLIRTFRGYVYAASAVVALFGFLGYREVSVAKDEIERQRKEVADQADALKREVASFNESVLPQYRAELERVVRLESVTAFEGRCDSPLAVEQVENWLSQKHRMSISNQDRVMLDGLFKRYNVCTLQQFQDILGHTIQQRIQELYRRCLKREPDVVGRFEWGLRLVRAWTFPEVERAVCVDSAEAQARTRPPSPSASR